MAIIIEETIKRPCCNPAVDLKLYRGKKKLDRDKFEFCIHCGQIWYHGRTMGPAGSMEPELQAIELC